MSVRVEAPAVADEGPTAKDGPTARAVWSRLAAPLGVVALALLGLVAPGAGLLGGGEGGDAREGGGAREGGVARERSPGDRPRDAPPKAVYTPEARALLGDLEPGEALHGWRVSSVDGVRDDGMIRVNLERDGVYFHVELWPRGAGGGGAPFQSARFDVFYTGADPAAAADGGASQFAAIEAVVARVRAGE